MINKVNQLAVRALTTAIKVKDIEGARKLLEVIYPVVVGQIAKAEELLSTLASIQERLTQVETALHNQQAFRNLDQ